MNPDQLKWSAQLRVATSTHSKRLLGDKITLPQSALEGLLAAAPVVPVQTSLRNHTGQFDPFNQYSFAAERYAREALADRQQQLPHPLTFRLVNPRNGRAIYAGIREFSAEEGEVELSPALLEMLGFDNSSTTTRSNSPMPGADTSPQMKDDTVTVHARVLQKGTYVRLRPLEAGYDPEDWKSLLERYLRDNFTTLTVNELLVVPGARHEKFRFLVDKFEPEGEAICIVDTDLEVDIEALNEEQARETLNKRLEKSKKAPDTVQGSSVGGPIVLDQEIRGQVLAGEYVDYELRQWDKTQDLEVIVRADNEDEVNIFVNPFSNKLRSKPRLDEYVFSDLSGRPAKRIKLSHTNIDTEEAEYLNIAIHSWRDSEETTSPGQPVSFSISISQTATKEDTSNVTMPVLDADEVLCKNCHQAVPKRTLHLHEAFCYRNNIACPKCQHVFLKNSEAWKEHWHCPHDDAYGSGAVTRRKHDTIFHPPSTIQCPACDFQAYNIPILAQHRTTDCPGKEILCQFCHLLVPQQGSDDPLFSDAEVLMSGMTPHEYADGARTTECHICTRIVRLRDMKVHLRIHDRERVGRVAPRLCTNRICRRTIKGGDEGRVAKEQLGLCDVCFGPLYISTYDPEGKALRRRIERRLLSQVVGGCGKPWCHNLDWCKSGHKNSTGDDWTLTTKDALPMIKPVLAQLVIGDANGAKLKFCVDEATQTRGATAELLAAENTYDLPWCVKSLEEEHGDLGRARNWLADRAPKTGETR